MTIPVHPFSFCLRSIDQNLPAVLERFPSALLSKSLVKRATTWMGCDNGQKRMQL